MLQTWVRLPLIFQLTRPVRGEPRARRAYLHEAGNFNSLAPCGANRAKVSNATSAWLFQLTRPVRGEPRSVHQGVFDLRISTHSPRAGRTRLCRTFAFPFVNFNSLAPCGANFNSLAPCGANRTTTSSRRADCKFQLTRPVRGEPMCGSER